MTNKHGLKLKKKNITRLLRAELAKKDSHPKKVERLEKAKRRIASQISKEVSK